MDISRVFGSRSFYKKALFVALPVMLEGLIQSMVSLVDNFMVAGLGDLSMAGVNVAGQVNMVFIVLLFNVVCPSAGIFMSQFKGANDRDGMFRVFKFKLIACLIMGALWTIITTTMPAIILSLMLKGNTQSAAILQEALCYETTLALGWIPASIATALASSLRETGHVRSPLAICIVATIVNAVCNYALIYGHLGASALGVRGAAIATIIAHVVELALFIARVAYRETPFIPRRKPTGSTISTRGLSHKILTKSLMVAISEMSWILAETISTAVYNGRGGAQIVSGMTGGFAIGNLFFVCFGGIFTATGVLLGTTLGSGDMKKARLMKNWIISGSAVMGVAFGLLAVLATKLIPIAFGALSYSALSIARNMLLVIAAYMPLWCIINSQYAVSRAGGDAAMGAILDLSANVMVLVIVFTLAHYTSFSSVTIYALMKLTDLYKIGFAYVWMKKEHWLCNLAKVA